MRIAVLGAGAVGSWIGGHLAMHGNDVHLLTTNTPHINAVRENGLEMRRGDRSQQVRIPIGHPEDFNSPVDLVIVLTKTFQLERALQSVANVFEDNSAVLSLQNGLGNGDMVSKYAGAENTWIGLTMLPVSRIAPGVVEGKGDGGTWFGHFNGLSSDLSVKIESAFEPTDISVQYDPDILKRVWEKVAFNTGMNAVCALTHTTPGQLYESPFALDLVRAVANEVAEVARAEKVNVNLASVYETIEFACKKHGAHAPSMLQDLMHGRRTEVDSLNGAIVHRAIKAGIDVPLNRQLAGLIRLAEAGHRE